jgi:hypothetical protein
LFLARVAFAPFFIFFMVVVAPVSQISLSNHDHLTGAKKKRHGCFTVSLLALCDWVRARSYLPPLMGCL